MSPINRSDPRLHRAITVLFFVCILGCNAGAQSRAEITDRNGVVLAKTVLGRGIYATPRDIRDVAATAATLSRVLPELNRAELRERLRTPSPFVWIAHHIDAPVAAAISVAGLPGIHLKAELQRVYPEGAVTSHVVGFTDSAVEIGQTGAERAFDHRLRNETESLALSLDLRVQRAVRDELQNSARTYHAIGGAALVLDAQTAEVLALVSLPDFDPADRKTIHPFGDKDRVTADTYEFSGLFGVFTAAIALDAKQVTPATTLPVSRTLRLGPVVLRDEEPTGSPLSVSEIFSRSSVVGMALIAARSSPGAQLIALHRLGLIDPITLSSDLIVAKPRLRADDWRPINRSAAGYGYGIAITPLQAAVVATGIVNEGWMLMPSLLRTPAAPAESGRRVVTAQTSVQIRALLRAAVVQGTGQAADVPGYEVGGKTGTALKLVAGTYSKSKRLNSFFAAFPLRNAPPRFTMLLLLDEPQALPGDHNQATAQWNVVPMAARIVEAIAPLLGVSRDDRLVRPN
jgi:cell division protein FtsI (penicillin-binding protein 3)